MVKSKQQEASTFSVDDIRASNGATLSFDSAVATVCLALSNDGNDAGG